MNDPVTFAQFAWMIGTLGGILVTFLGFIIRTLQTVHSRISNLARELAEYKLEVAKEYVNRASLSEVESRVIKRLDKLEAMLATALNRKPAG